MRQIALFILFLSPLVSSGQLLPPSEFLGYDLGERFTRHHDMISYFEHVSEAVPHLQIIKYGYTNEHRPLIAIIISSKKNMAKLEQIRLNNLKRTGLIAGNPSDDGIAIVWLSYNVHGNEASSLDASIKTLYQLADVNNSISQKWLKNTVVIIDPCLNPDGRERYVNHYLQTGNITPNPDGDSKEHREPWPSGRPNHYLFDLNRDWAWQTQVETQQRIALYNQWMPHIHVDFHEQSYKNPYYFAPAAEPFHEQITDWQRKFQTTIGKNHAQYFDKEGWLYFTKQFFDLLYPSYGDTYPVFNGAIGMTYEQAGHGFAGLAITTEDDDVLTLKDRITHHYTTSLSTIEISSQHARQLTDEFTKYFSKPPTYQYKTYVVKSTNQPDKINKLLNWLNKHQIKYGQASASKSWKGLGYRNGRQETFAVNTSDIVLSTDQPKGKLLTVLFEPNTKLSDSVTYDITAWSIPYAYDLDAFACKETIGHKKYTSVASKKGPNHSDNQNIPYAYLIDYKSIADLRFVTSLMQSGINVRTASKPFTLEGKRYHRGTIVITRKNNSHYNGDLEKNIDLIASKHSQSVAKCFTGFMNTGSDFGSADYFYVKSPKIALLGGDQVNSLSFGEIWHYFEKEISYPVNVIYTDYFEEIGLDKYYVLIIPNGRYRLFSESMLKKIHQWVTKGGKLILIQGALKSFADKEGFGLKKYATEEEKKLAEDKKKARKEHLALSKYADQERNEISEYITGGIFKTTLDNTHPLGYGYPSHYFTLKNNTEHYAYLANGGNVAVIKDASSHVSGFVGDATKDRTKKSLVFGVEKIGSGNVVYMVDNPLYRAFWENGKLLFGNAVFMLR